MSNMKIEKAYRRDDENGDTGLRACIVRRQRCGGFLQATLII